MEHGIHFRHRAHVPSTDGLGEGRGILQRSEERADVWSERRCRSEGTGAAADTATEEQQQHAGWRSTYIEHGMHVRHRAHVPSTDGLIEDLGLLQGSEWRAAVWSERRSRSGGIGNNDDEDTALLEQRQHAGWRGTYREHGPHARHLAHVPSTDGLIEGTSTLQRREGRTAAWSER